MKYKKSLILISLFSITILVSGIAYYLLVPSPAEKFLITDKHGRTYVSFVEDPGVTSYDHYSNDHFAFSNTNADLLNSSNGHLVTAFSKNKQIFQSVFFSDADLDISSYSKAKKLYKSDLEQFIGLNNSNKMHGVNHAGNGNGAMDETVSKYRYKVSGRNTIIISGEVNNGDDNTWKQQIIKLTDIRENKNGSWSLIASRPDESNKIVKTSLILFPQTVE